MAGLVILYVEGGGAPLVALMQLFIIEERDHFLCILELNKSRYEG